MAEAHTPSAPPTGGRRTKPPFRADHVGSLLRPKHLLAAREDLAAGRIGADELRALEDEAIRDVVRMQRDVGLQSATDGEFRRGSWHMDFIYQLGGIEQVQGDINVKFRNAEGEVDFKPAAIMITDSSGPTWRPRMPSRSRRSPPWAAPTCSSTTRASPISTTRASVRR